MKIGKYRINSSVIIASIVALIAIAYKNLYIKTARA